MMEYNLIQSQSWIFSIEFRKGRRLSNKIDSLEHRRNDLLDRVEERAKIIIDDIRLSNKIDFLEHRQNVGYILLF